MSRQITKKLFPKRSFIAKTNRNKADIEKKGRFKVMKNRPVRATKFQPALNWSNCSVCNKDMWTNRMSLDVYDMYSSPYSHKVYRICNSQRCLNLLIFQEL